jgi:hypothetical protein
MEGFRESRGKNDSHRDRSSIETSAYPGSIGCHADGGFRRPWRDVAWHLARRLGADLAESARPPKRSNDLSVYLAAHHGCHCCVLRRDANSGRSPYLSTILINPATRSARLHEGLIATARIILLGLCMDVIYQFIELKAFHPGEAVIIALLLAFVPYLLLRGPFARIVCRWRGIAMTDGSR